MKKSLLLATIASLLFTGCMKNENYALLQTKKENTQTVRVNDRSIEYRILPQDRLEIALYKDPAQSSEFGGGVSGDLGQSMKKNGILVDAHGYVALPLVGKVKLSGLTQTQAAGRLTKAYKKYLNTPTVYVEVLNKRIFVLGEVKKPGVVNLDKEKMTLFEALAHAGDLTDSAVRTEIVIVSNNRRRGMQMRKIDLTNFDKMNYSQLMLRPNDIVYVKPSNWKQFKVTTGEMATPFAFLAAIASPFVTLKYLGN